MLRYYRLAAAHCALYPQTMRHGPTAAFPSTALHTVCRAFGNAPSRVRPLEIVKQTYNNTILNLSVWLPFTAILLLIGAFSAIYYDRVVKHKTDNMLEFAMNYNKTAHWSKQSSHTDHYNWPGDRNGPDGCGKLSTKQ